MGQVLVMLDLILPQWLTGHNGVEAMEYNHAGLTPTQRPDGTRLSG